MARTALMLSGATSRPTQPPELQHRLLESVRRHRQAERRAQLATVRGARGHPVGTRVGWRERHPELIAIVGRHAAPRSAADCTSPRVDVSLNRGHDHPCDDEAGDPDRQPDVRAHRLSRGRGADGRGAARSRLRRRGRRSRLSVRRGRASSPRWSSSSSAIEPEDAVVIYYSGHGGRVPRPDAEAAQGGEADDALPLPGAVGHRRERAGRLPRPAVRGDDGAAAEDDRRVRRPWSDAERDDDPRLLPLGLLRPRRGRGAEVRRPHRQGVAAARHPRARAATRRRGCAHSPVRRTRMRSDSWRASPSSRRTRWRAVAADDTAR